MVTIVISTRIISYHLLAISIEFPIMDSVLKLCLGTLGQYLTMI